MNVAHLFFNNAITAQNGNDHLDFYLDAIKQPIQDDSLFVVINDITDRSPYSVELVGESEAQTDIRNFQRVRFKMTMSNEKHIIRITNKTGGTPKDFEFKLVKDEWPTPNAMYATIQP